MIRRRFNTILGLSAAVLAAAAAGVQLGESAIAEINPIHFQGAATPPNGIDPAALAPPPDAFASAYGWEAGQAALAEACGGDCNARLARNAVAHADAAPAPVQLAATAAWRDATPPAELALERYMDYPIEQPAEAPGEKPPPGDEESGAD